MKKLFYLFLLPTLTMSLSGANVFVYDFNNGGAGQSNGTQLNAALNTGDDFTSAWSAGGAPIQTRSANSGHLNVGQTHYYQGLFSNGSGISNLNSTHQDNNDLPADTYRTLDFGDLNSSNTSTFTFTAVFDAWQLNAANTASSAGRGLLFQLRNGSGNNAAVALKTGTTNAGASYFGQAYSQGSGSISGAFAGTTAGVGASSANWLTSPDSADTKDLTLQISGDLTTGNWTSRASVSGSNADNANVGSLVWTDLITNGTGLTAISDLQMRIMGGDTPGWGTPSGQGNQPRNWVTVDYLSLDATAVPEPSTYALLLGFGSFIFIAIRKRK